MACGLILLWKNITKQIFLKIAEIILAFVVLEANIILLRKKLMTGNFTTLITICM